MVTHTLVSSLVLHEDEDVRIELELDIRATEGSLMIDRWAHGSCSSVSLSLPHARQLVQFIQQADAIAAKAVAITDLSPTSSDALPATAGPTAGSEQPCPVASDPAGFSQKGGA